MKTLFIISTIFYLSMILIMLLIGATWSYIVAVVCIIGYTFDIVSYRRAKKGKKVYTIRNLFR